MTVASDWTLLWETVILNVGPYPSGDHQKGSQNQRSSCTVWSISDKLPILMLFWREESAMREEHAIQPCDIRSWSFSVAGSKEHRFWLQLYWFESLSASALKTAIWYQDQCTRSFLSAGVKPLRHFYNKCVWMWNHDPCAYYSFINKDSTAWRIL